MKHNTAKYLIEGGVPLRGVVGVSGAKNESIKLISAALLTEDEVVLENVPRIGDVDMTLRMIRSFGVVTEWQGANKLSIKSSRLHSSVIPRQLSLHCRSALLNVGPLLARLGEATLPHSGGDKLGQRSTNRFFMTWEVLGATFQETPAGIKITCSRLKGADICFKRSSHTATESAILSAVLAEGQTTIYNAAEEPEIDDLIEFLNQMGAKIFRIEQKKIVIDGVKSLHGTSFTVGPDRNETVTLMLAAAVTGGEITLKNVRPVDLTAFFSKLTKVGVGYEIVDRGKSIKVWRDATTPLTQIDLVQTRPHPGFMTDWQPPISVLMLLAEGTGLIQETIYIDRFDYIKELNRMGAKIELITATEAGLPFILDHDGYNPEVDIEPLTVARIVGPVTLKRQKLIVSDLRAGATLVLASLCAEGKSEISGVEKIERGYERLDLKLQSLGAKIERVG